MNLVSLIGRIVKRGRGMQQPSGRVCLIIPSRCKMCTAAAMILIIHTLSKWS